MNLAIMREKQLNMRLNEEEAERLAKVADHFGLNAAGLIRMLVKEKYDAIAATTTADFDPLKSRAEGQMFADLLRAIGNEETAEEGAMIDEIARAIGEAGYPFKHHKIWKAMKRMLNELRRAGYVEKVRGAYRLTEKGKAA